MTGIDLLGLSLGLAAVVALFGYLGYALIHPERF
ncbi:MAG: K(+)-transporting ATPase subunit F [Magnetospirillum sp. WYHS-4]